MSVVDASAALEVLLRTPAAAAIEKRLFANGQTLHAPHLIDLEVAHVLRRYAAASQITPDCTRRFHGFSDPSLSASVTLPAANGVTMVTGRVG